MTSKIERVLREAEELAAANPEPLTEGEQRHLIGHSDPLCPACLSFIARADAQTVRCGS